MVTAVPIGFRIKERRRTLGITQVAMAKDLGISPSYLNLIEANKRPIAGRLLNQISRILDLDLDSLTGETERRLVEELQDVATDPSVRHSGVEPASASEFVGRFPAWAGALRSALRAGRVQTETIEALSDRLSQDPALSDALYRIITHATAIRSTSEILEGEEAVPPDTRTRFQAMIGEESAALASAAQTIVGYFDRPDAGKRSASPIEEVDYLDQAHGISVTAQSPMTAVLPDFRNQAHFDPESGTLIFLENATQSTRRFQMAVRAAKSVAADAVDELVQRGEFSGDVAAERARRALNAYVAGACLFPYQQFLGVAEHYRYDIEQLHQRYAGSYEQIAHRLVTLRQPGAEGVPFGFLRADPSGYLSKRFPLAGLPIPSSGTGCPLWAVFAAFQAPERIVRQVVEFPNHARFLFVARTVTKDPARFHEAPFLRAVMLVCDTIHADRTVYADGIDVSSRQSTVPVGPSCRLCTRSDCLHRAEDAILAG